MGYRSRLTRDVDRWITAGWIDAARRDDILADIAPRRTGWSATGALAILGAVLLAMSALTFVAANWDAMPKLLRFALILAALWASLAGAGRAFDKDAGVLGHALAVLGVALFGAAIMLTAQTFNMTSFRNTAVLIWTVAALLTAWAIPSRPVLILATALGALWAGLEHSHPFVDGLIWTYLPLWAITGALALRLHSTVSMHLLALGLLLWLGHALAWYHDIAGLSGLPLHAAATLLLGAIALAGAVLRDRRVPGGGIVSAWFAIAAMAVGLTLQFQLEHTGGGTPDVGASWLSDPAYLTLALPALAAIAALAILRLLAGRAQLTATASFVAAALVVSLLPLAGALETGASLMASRILVGALFYAAATALILQGTSTGSRASTTVGVTAFIGQTLYVYGETFGGLLDTALFFFVGGAILFGLSLVAWRWQRRGALAPGQGGAS